MLSKTAPTRLHVAIFPSVRAIANAGGKDMQFNHIEGRFSRNLFGKRQMVTSRFIKVLFSKMYEQAIISWKVEEDGKLATIGELLQDLAKNNIIDMAIKEITFVIASTQYNNYSMKNESIQYQWTFHPFTFRPTVWKRLKASKNFPGRNLYLQSIEVKRNLKKETNQDVFKRWKDVILLNDKDEHSNLENYEIRNLWMDKKFALLIRETQGEFELMDIGEWRK
jgi:hypothetical protein